ncbi:MAG: hypothetical protein GC162_15405 [Planctomycetes bacterium]|nr:hypothetical protein [Planctomycetota bacterium]
MRNENASKVIWTLTAALCLSIGATAHAAVTDLAVYHLTGTAGDPAGLPVDSSGNGNDFAGGTVPPAPVYSGDVPVGTGGGTSVSFPTGPSGFYFTTAAFPEDNFGFEVWAKTTQAAADGHLLGNSSNASGIEVGTTGNNFYAAISSVAFVAQVPIVDNVWTHLALVRDNGTTSFYINGVFIASSALAPIPLPNSGPPFPIGANAHFGVDAGGSSGYEGLADEAHFFTFDPGAFEVGDLSFFAAPAPAALPSGLVLMSMLAGRRRRA